MHAYNINGKLFRLITERTSTICLINFLPLSDDELHAYKHRASLAIAS